MAQAQTEERKVFSNNREYAVGYYSRDSKISLFMRENDSYTLLVESERHSCTILGVVFIDENFFISLDSGSIVRIWKIHNDDLRVCQSIESNELNDKKVSGIDLHDYANKQIKLITKQGYDIYSVSLNKYKHGKKNSLFSYVDTIMVEQAKQPLSEHRSEKKQQEQLQFEVQVKKEKTTVDPAKKLLDDVTISHENMDKFYYNKTVQIDKKPKKGKSVKKSKRQIDIPLSEITQSRDNSSSANDSDNDFGIVFDIPKYYIGFDMGTSRSKICYLKEDEPQRNVEIMTFGHKGADNSNIPYESWALPTVATIVGERVEYGFDALDYPQEEHYYDLKRSLLDSEFDNSAMCMKLAAGYVAYVYKKCRETILESLGQEGINDDSVQCQLSICVPVTQIDNDEGIKRLTRFRLLAEQVYTRKIFNSFNEISLEYDRIFGTQAVDAKPRFIDIVPEVLAEIRGYHKQKVEESIGRDKRSAFDSYALVSRKTGSSIYAIYDLGAGTTDLSIMSLNIDSDVSNRHGVGRGGKIYQTKIIYRGFSDIKNHHDDAEVFRFYKEVLEDLREAWTNFYHEDFTEMSGCLGYIKDAVICLTGGGAECAVARKVFREIPFYRAVGEFEITDKVFVLSGPGFWDEDNKFPPYHRFGVSFGLTDDPRDLNRLYELPSRAEAFDNTQKQKELTEEEINENRKKFVG